MVSTSMSCVLAIQPDSAQAEILRKAFRGHIKEEVVVAGSLDEALASIDKGIPDVVLVPTLAPASVEDYLTSYLGSIPGTRHVQILGLPRLERSESGNPGRSFLFFNWRKRNLTPRAIDAPVCDPGVFTQDVVAYVAGVKALKDEIRRYGLPDDSNDGADRRRAYRFGTDEVPWIAEARFGDDKAVVINVSSTGALLRTQARPERHYLRRPDAFTKRRSRLTFELQWNREVHATGQIIRCIPVKTASRTHYEIAFTFDDAVGLHLPVVDAMVPTQSAQEEDGWVIHI